MGNPAGPEVMDIPAEMAKPVFPGRMPPTAPAHREPLPLRHHILPPSPEVKLVKGMEERPPRLQLLPLVVMQALLRPLQLTQLLPLAGIRRAKL